MNKFLVVQKRGGPDDRDNDFQNLRRREPRRAPAFEEIRQDVVLAVFESLFRGQASFDPAKGRFRQFLTTLCQRRVVDFIRSHARRSSKLTPLNSDSFEEKEIDPALVRPSTAEEDAFRNALLGTLLSALHAEVSPRTYLIFELVKLNGESPEDVAAQLGVRRNVIDNTVFKAMKKLREISKREEIQQEL